MEYKINGQLPFLFLPDVDLTFHISSLVFLCLQYFLPVALMTYFYSMVAKTIWSRRDICEMMDGTSHKLTKELQMLKSKRKVSAKQLE